MRPRIDIDERFADFFKKCCDESRGRGDYASANRGETLLSLDLTGAVGKVTYYDRGAGAVRPLAHADPWEAWSMDGPRDAGLFGEVLRGILEELGGMGLGPVRHTALVVPHSFTYNERREIKEIAQGLGIETVDVDTAGMFCAMSRPYLEDDRFDIVYNLQSGYFELSLVEWGDGVYESYGTAGVAFGRSFVAVDEDDLKRAVRSTAEQLLRDQGLLVKDGAGIHRASDYLSRYYDCAICVAGTRSLAVEEVMRELLGGVPVVPRCDATLGGLLQCGVLSCDVGGHLRLASQDRAVWVRLDDFGEKKVAVKRYTNIPTRGTVTLDYLGEPFVKVYEGDYLNPDLDCLVMCDPLWGLDAERGDVLMCEVDIEPRGEISLRVRNLTRGQGESD